MKFVIRWTRRQSPWYWVPFGLMWLGLGLAQLVVDGRDSSRGYGPIGAGILHLLIGAVRIGLGPGPPPASDDEARPHLFGGVAFRLEKAVDRLGQVGSWLPRR